MTRAFYCSQSNRGRKSIELFLSCFYLSPKSPAVNNLHFPTNRPNQNKTVKVTNTHFYHLMQSATKSCAICRHLSWIFCHSPALMSFRRLRWCSDKIKVPWFVGWKFIKHKYTNLTHRWPTSAMLPIIIINSYISKIPPCVAFHSRQISYIFLNRKSNTLISNSQLIINQINWRYSWRDSREMTHLAFSSNGTEW